MHICETKCRRFLDKYAFKGRPLSVRRCRVCEEVVSCIADVPGQHGQHRLLLELFGKTQCVIFWERDTASESSVEDEILKLYIEFISEVDPFLCITNAPHEKRVVPNVLYLCQDKTWAGFSAL